MRTLRIIALAVVFIGASGILGTSGIFGTSGVFCPTRSIGSAGLMCSTALAANSSARSSTLTPTAAQTASPVERSIARTITGVPGGGFTLAQFKALLAAEKRGRTISEATPDELEQLLPSEGGLVANLGNREYVVRVGISTFILDMRLIVGVIAIALTVIVLFFTPIGLAIGRGKIHAAVGSVLASTGVAPDFGTQLQSEPRRWLMRERSVRKAFARYMHNEFIPQYKNNITAIAFMGTAFLIMSIGLRGIKFMTAHQPDLIIIAIVTEMAVLCLLGLTTWYEKQYELKDTAAAPAAASIDMNEWIRREDAVRLIDQVKTDIEAAWREEMARQIHRSAA